MTALHKLTLPNGLRVVLAPDHNAPVFGLAVHYDVGFRSEPENRTGFAHLFEHLMFQGSESLDKLAHFKHVQGSGGTFNGSTHPDYTEYHEMAPSAALERVLFLEADRMRAPKITAENLRNQVDVVKEEIRLNVLNRPYGGFPWILLPPVLYSTFPNAHNGYGDFSELEQATVADCASFFDTFYCPANAVLTVAGDIDVEQATALIEKHFGDVPARDKPVRPSFAEPAPERELRENITDPHAPLPAVALGYRLPDPAAEMHGYLACEVLAGVLSEGASSRLQQRMVHTEPLVTDVHAGCGLTGSPLDGRDPDTFTITAIHPGAIPVDRVIGVVDEELEKLASTGPTEEELARYSARWRSMMHSEHDQLISRVLDYGTAELLQGRAELIDELPELISSVSAADVMAAAKSMRPDSRAVLTVTPAESDTGSDTDTEVDQ